MRAGNKQTSLMNLRMRVCPQNSFSTPANLPVSADSALSLCMPVRHASTLWQTVGLSGCFRHTRSQRQLQVATRAFRRISVCSAATEKPSIQLATAKLPSSVNAEAFTKSLYDWASTLTSSGRNMPFSLPLRTRQKDGGLEISLLRVSDEKAIVAVGHIFARVEAEPQVGEVLFVRFFEGEGSQLIRKRPLPDDPQQRLKTVIDGLVDVPLIMNTMRNAIKQAATQAK